MRKYKIAILAILGCFGLLGFSTAINIGIKEMFDNSGRVKQIKLSTGQTYPASTLATVFDGGGGSIDLSGTQTTGINPVTKGGTGTNTATLAGFTHTGTSTFPSGIWGSTGNVGIGTTNITEKLTLGDGVTAGGIVTRLNANAANWAGMGINKAGTEKWFVGMGDTSTYGDKFLIRRTSSSDDIVIDTAGSIGMGTTTPATKLHVVGTVTASTGFSGNGSALTNVTATPALNSVDATHLKSVINATDTNFNVGSLTVTTGNFRLDSTGSATAVTVTVTGTTTMTNLTVDNLTVVKSAVLPGQASTTGSASVTVGGGQSYTMNSVGSPTNSIVLNCSGVISATNTGSMNLTGLQGGVTLGSTTTKLSNTYVTTPYVIINEWSEVSYYGTTTTNLWTGTITGGLMGAYDSLWIYTDMEFSSNDSKLVQVSLGGVNLSASVAVGTSTRSWSGWTTLTNKGTVASNVSRSGFIGLNTNTNNAFTAQTIDTSGNMPLIIRAAHNNLAGTSTLHYLQAILYKKP